MLYYIFGICNSITCTPGTTSQALLSSTFTYGTYTIPKVTKMRYGSVSSKIYLFGSLSNVGTPYSFIRKTGSDDTTVWSTISYTQFDSNSFDLDYTESYAYTILAETATTLVRFNTADGSYDFAKEQSPTFCFAQTGYTYSLSCSPNSQTVFFSASDNLNKGFICRFQIGTANFDCVLYSDAYQSIAMISADSNVLFVDTVDFNTHMLEFRKVDFSDSSFEIWLSQIAYTSGTYPNGADKVLYKSPSVYLLVKFNASIYFIQLSSSSGSLVSQYKCSDGTCVSVSDMNIYNDLIYLAFKCSNYYISVYSITTSLFEYYYINDITITLNAIVSDTSRIYLGGVYSNAYFTSTLVSAITANQKISSVLITMDLYSTGQSESVISSPITTKSIITASITDSSSVSLDTASTITNIQSPTDTQYYVSSVSYTGLTSSTTYSKSISLTCSTDGSTSIIYSLVSYNGQTLPSWVTLDSSNQLLNFTTPVVSTATTYQFAVQATISGSNYQTPVTLSVNAATSSSNSASTQTSKDTYTSDISSSTTSTIASTSISVISATTISTSLISGSSPQSLWVTINQFQFFMMIPMIGAFIPDVIINFLQGVSFCMFNFNFIRLPKSGISGYFLAFFNCSETSSYLSTIGITSVCMIVNQIKLIIALFIIMILHIPIYFISKRLSNNRTRLGKFIKFIFMLLTFTVYLRTIIEAYMVVFLSIINEFYVHDLSSGSKIISFCISVIVFNLLILFWVSTFYISKNSTNINYNMEESYFSEVVEGTKSKIACRLLIFVSITRIMLSVLCVILTQSLAMMIRISLFVAIQTIFFIFTVFIRQFEKTSDNIIQILNDFVYLFACIALFRYNTESNWANGYITSFFAIITANGLVVTLIQLTVFIFELRKLPCCKRKINQIKITPEASINDQIEIPRVEVRPETNMNMKEGSINSKKEEIKETSFDRFYAYKSNKIFR